MGGRGIVGAAQFESIGKPDNGVGGGTKRHEEPAARSGSPDTRSNASAASSGGAPCGRDAPRHAHRAPFVLRRALRLPGGIRTMRGGSRSGDRSQARRGVQAPRHTQRQVAPSPHATGRNGVVCRQRLEALNGLNVLLVGRDEDDAASLPGRRCLRQGDFGRTRKRGRPPWSRARC